ncbi:MAG: tetratricopeptide repeat protein [Acidiferrobacterales bacterium]
MDRLPRKLAAILYADVAGYSRLMGSDEDETHRTLCDHLDLIAQSIKTHRGDVMHYAGDAVLAKFDAVLDALSCARDVQERLRARNADLPADRRLEFRIGVNLGDVIEDRSDIYGEGVNLAARLESLADAGGICISESVKVAIGNKLSCQYESLGEQRVKNIAEPIRAYRVLLTPGDGRAAPPAKPVIKLPDRPSLAILPFKTVSGDVEQESLADGLRIDVQAALVKIAGLLVIAIATTNTYRNKEISAAQAAAEMGVRHILEGNVQKSGNRVRITVSLIDSTSKQVVWTERYDRVLDDAFEVQDEITEKIVTALDVKLASGEPAKVWRKTIKDPKAREYFYRGLHEFMKGDKEAMGIARENFERVARLAPDSPLGPTYVAFSHWWDAFRGWSDLPSQSLDLAAEWAEKAMAMEDCDGQAHTVMGHIHLLRREHDQALAVAERAVSLRPQCVHANGHLGNILYYCGRPGEAVDYVKRAIRNTPIYPPWFVDILAASYKEAGQLDNATASAREALRLKPDDLDARLVLVDAYQSAGRNARAREIAQEVLAIDPSFSLARWSATQPYREDAVLARIVESLREAGLRE